MTNKTTCIKGAYLDRRLVEEDEEWKLDWEWQCSNCGKNLTDRYDDLDIKTPEPLKNASSAKSINTVISLLKLKKALMKRNYMAITTHQSPH